MLLLTLLGSSDIRHSPQESLLCAKELSWLTPLFAETFICSVDSSQTSPRSSVEMQTIWISKRNNLCVREGGSLGSSSSTPEGGIPLIFSLHPLNRSLNRIRKNNLLISCGPCVDMIAGVSCRGGVCCLKFQFKRLFLL